MKENIFKVLYFIGSCALAGMCLAGTYGWTKRAIGIITND